MTNFWELKENINDYDFARSRFTFTVRRYLLSTNILVIHLLTLSNNHLKFGTKEEQMDGWNTLLSFSKV